MCVVLAVLPSLGATVTVDATKTGTPISKYIYGQFIEHLGRCIYGGLWSEMLEDRKFFYPVTGEAPAWEMYKPSDRSYDGEGHPYELLMRSPWMIDRSETGRADGRPRDAFVGEHTPEITLARRRQAGGTDAGAARTGGGQESTWAGSSSRGRTARGPSRSAWCGAAARPCGIR